MPSTPATDSSMALVLMEAYEVMGNTLALQYGGSDAHSLFFQRKKGQSEASLRSKVRPNTDDAHSLMWTSLTVFSPTHAFVVSVTCSLMCIHGIRVVSMQVCLLMLYEKTLLMGLVLINVLAWC